MKNGINTSKFHVKTGFLGNGRRNLISTSVNIETGSHKYGNRRTKIENGTGRNENISVRFQPYLLVLTIAYGILCPGPSSQENLHLDLQGNAKGSDVK